MLPGYALLPPGEYNRLAPPVAGIPTPTRDADFTAADVRVSAEDRLDAIAARIALERGLSVRLEPFASPRDRLRARGIPFRGNPGDVLLVDRADLPGGPRLFVPLGGDLMT
ncbi:MAG: hypothetical protein L0027_08935, partial [Candidatus Rokubacteria bacterium]|nr:hypothetical protein [Candidatus Rokubacteria bacterium]